MKIGKILSFFLFVAIIFSFCIGAVTYAAIIEVEEYELSSDSRLAEARDAYDKGQRFIEKGNREYRGRAGLAQKHFETAEDYFNIAAFQYKELGRKYGIDTSHEVSVCERLSRRAHVGVTKSRKARKRTGSAL
jgi:hypothetical protein